MKNQIKLVVFDQDGVLVLGDALDDMAEYLGQGAASRELTKRLQAGKISLREVLAEKQKLFSDLPSSRVTKALTGIKYDPDTKTTIDELHRQGIKVMLVTGSWTITAFFTQRKFKIDYTTSSDEKTTMEGVKKIEAIDQVARQLGIKIEQILAIGNSNADTPMLRHAGLGLCLRPVGGIEKEFREILKLSDVLKYILTI